MIRKVGVATSFLFRSNPLHGVEVVIKGFGGELLIHSDPDLDGEVKFIAGGIGVTPLLPILPGVNLRRVKLWWCVRDKDLELVEEVLREWPGLAEGTRVFVTGGSGDGGRVHGRVERRRIRKEDLELEVGNVDSVKWWVCAGRGLRGDVEGWLREEGREVVGEDFEF
ncbi:hypothetical protein RUND412_002821 [Rhizina undulata]